MPANGDLRKLIETIAEIGSKKSGFSLTNFIEAMGDIFVTIDPRERKKIRMFSSGKAFLLNIFEKFSSILGEILGTMEGVEVKISSEELLSISSSYQPENKHLFKKIISDSEKNFKIIFEEIKSAFPEYDSLPEAEDCDEDSEKVTSASGVQYILNQAEHQKENVKNYLELVEETRDAVIRICEESPNVFKKTEKTFFHEKIVYFSKKKGFALPELPWQQIFEESNIQILQGLLVLSSLLPDEIILRNCFLYFLETKHRWEKLFST
ncbi:MAG: hypothetical protein HQM08_16215 [Candidatus Riflebacteria bacterium]|nr:hypothetical protein [Candidatus Riflebacteria bacterium]